MTLAGVPRAWYLAGRTEAGTLAFFLNDRSIVKLAREFQKPVHHLGVQKRAGKATATSDLLAKQLSGLAALRHRAR